jgi:hypothetical protein
MRIAIYDRYWDTAGGGERLAGAIASVLAAPAAPDASAASGTGHDVVLLAPQPIDATALGRRMGLDLSRVGVEVLAPGKTLEQVSSSHDLLVTVSWKNADRNGARHGLYVVMFPSLPGDDWARGRWARCHRILVDRLAPWVRTRVDHLELRSGSPERALIRAQDVYWIDGTVDLTVVESHTRRRTADPPVTLRFGRFLPGTDPVRVRVLDGGGTAADLVVAPAHGRWDRLRAVSHRVDRRPGETPSLRITSDAPVPLLGAQVGSTIGARLAGRFSALIASPPDHHFLDTYDRVVSISEFTRQWVRRRWGIDTEVLYPAVPPRPARGKESFIVSVGRFFDASRGHSKKQVELVQAFGRLHRSGNAPGWDLHLVGGCHPDDRPYVVRVEEASVGLPVHLHVNASRAEVDSLLGRASIYWHGAGLGATDDDDPAGMEHFGISTVEAMSAAAVPIVAGVAGQLEVLDDGVEGFHVADADALVERTIEVIGDPALRARLAAAAVLRAQRFGPDRFAAELWSLVDGIVSGSTPR